MKRERPGQAPHPAEHVFTPFDQALVRFQERIFGRYRYLTVLTCVGLYLLLSFTLHGRLGVSTNFFVVLPVIVAAASFGWKAGLAFGMLGLPANLAIYAILGHPEFAPESKLMAELAGIMVGGFVGYLSDFYRKLNVERRVRREIEDELRSALRDRETLFREVHHRVKNNLNLIKSLIGIQARRSPDPAFRQAALDLQSRVMSISLIHEQLYRTSELSSVSMNHYLAQLAKHAVDAASDPERPPMVRLDCPPELVSMDTAVPLGLAANEAITNAIKHGRKAGSLSIAISLERRGALWELAIVDDGDDPEVFVEMDTRSEAASGAGDGRMGLTLIGVLAGQLGGWASYRRDGGQTRFTLSFPAER